MKIKVGVLFGGKTVEHEISIISAIQAMGYLNRDKYDVIPIYITKNNEFYVGENIKAEDVKAKFENGMLNIVLPSKEQKSIETKQTVTIE